MLLNNKLIIITGLTLLLGACGGSGGGEKMPVTTSSEEALADYQAGLEYLDNIRTSEANQMFERAIEKDPKFAMAHIYAIANGPPDAQAQKHLRKAMQLAPHVSKGEQILIKAFKSQFDGDQDQSLELLQQLTDLYPDDERAHFLLGSTLYNGYNPKAGLKSLNKAISINKDFAPPYNLLGYYYKAQGDYDEAEKALLKYSSLLPDEANPYDSMGDLLVDKGDYDKAIEYFLKSFSINPGFTVSMRKAAINQVFLGRYDEARANYRIAYEADQSVFDKALTLHGLARSYAYEGNLEGARPIIAEALELANSSGSKLLQGQVYWGMTLMSLFRGDLEQARSSLALADEIIFSHDLDFNNQVFLNEVKKATFLMHVFLDVREGDLESATESITRFEAAHSADEAYDWQTIQAEAYGLVEYTRGNYDTALAALETVEDPSASNLFYQAKINLLQGNTGRGMQLMQKVATRNNDEDNYYPLVRGEAIATLAAAQ